VLLNGAVSITFNNGTVQCIGGTAFLLQSSGTGNGDPSLNIDSTFIQNTEVGIWATAGTAEVTNSTINFNVIGVQQDTDGTNNGTTDLSGGGNTVVCSDNKESVIGNLNPGIDVYNTSTKNLDASNVAWDTSGPDYFSCDPAFTSCVCNLGSCTTTPGDHDMDAVEDSNNLGGVTTTGNTLSGISCN
jgi:hypothetical protein